jgi:toxin-antitoxin system PIN domain toxin
VIVPDVNLLLYAEIDAFPQHATARRWWEQTLGGERQVGLCSASLFGFIRIATSRRVFETPMTIDDALGRASMWLERRHVSFLVPGHRHIEIAFDLLRRQGTGGNLTTDVQIAAYAIESGGEVHTNDLDFGRFDGLRWHNPLRT